MSSRRSTSKESKKSLLIDTSFLLPAMGIDVGEEIIETVKHFHEFKVCYIEASILEAMWKIIKMISPDKFERIREGLEAITNTYKLVSPPPKAYIDACKLYQEGHEDYIDNLLYATSKELNIQLLTIDRTFIKFLQEREHPTDNIVTPSEFLNSGHRALGGGKSNK